MKGYWKRKNFFLTGHLLLLLVIGMLLLLVACGQASPTTSGASNNTVSPTGTASLPSPASSPITTTPPATEPSPPATVTLPPVRVGVGGTAPEFSATDVNGQPLQLSALRGKVVMLNFWQVY